MEATNNSTNELLKEIIQDVIETCSVKGLMVKTVGTNDSVAFNHAPISIFPTPFPSKHFDQAKQHQRALGFMVNDLTRKPDMIHDLLKYFKQHDTLMQKMLKISESFMQSSKDVKIRQDIQYLILRSDYMIDKDTDTLKMVEYNTVASSFGCLCQKVAEVQNYVIDKYRENITLNYKNEDQDQQSQLTQITSLAKSFDQAVQLYAEDQKLRFPEIYQSKDKQDYWCLFVIDSLERNVCDQKWIEEVLYQTFGLRSMRLTFAQIGKLAKVDPQTNALFINNREIAFVYYRTGYQLEQYETDQDWQTRELLELAQPIKCPSIDVQLTTFKKFQQAFADENILKEVMSEHQEEAESIKGLFKGIWTLEDIGNQDAKELHDIVKQAIENPHQFVIKPQKEGGGNNFYDEDVRTMITENNTEYLKQFLIMERINPPEVKAYMLRNGELLESDTLSELGIYSSVVIRTNTASDNLISSDKDINTFGRLLRTKSKDSNEGGVNAGFAVIDSPYLVKIEDIKSEKIQPSVSFK